MDELGVLRAAKAGTANYATDRLMTIMGEAGYWDLEHVGDEPVPTYVAHGNFLVDREGVFRSYLTDKGERDLERLEWLATLR